MEKTPERNCSIRNSNPAPRGINPIQSDIGRKVVYRTAPNYEAEEGVITSLAGPLVFVRYGASVISQGTSLGDLDWFMTHAEFDLERRKPRKGKTPMLGTLDRIREIIDRTQRHIAREAEEGHTTEYRLGAAEEILRIVLRDLKELVE